MARNPMTDFLQPRPSARQLPSNPMAMLAEFRQFMALTSPQRAEQEVKQLLASGQMSAQQFEELKRQAQTLMPYFSK